MKEITQNRLTKALCYSSSTGLFKWRISKAKNIKPGTVAGCTNSIGYVVIRIDKKLYLAHRLAWLYSYGYLPENNIDHIDRNRCNNSLCNLREASQSCNMRNANIRINNTSGIPGVCWIKNRMEWYSFITVKMKMKGLGSYKHFHDAVCARLVAEQCLDWSTCEASSPAYKYVQKMLNKD